MSEEITIARIRNSLKNRENLVQFLGAALGYRTGPVLFRAADWDVAPHLARQVYSWWLVSHYPGNLPFQIHLVWLREKPTFAYCKNLIGSFSGRHPGHYCFVFTKDYLYVLFMAFELSFERNPKPGRPVWIFGPKPYPRLLLIDRENPTLDDARTLNQMKIGRDMTNPTDLHNHVVQALKSLEYHSPLPEWFVPYFYRYRDPTVLCLELGKIGELLLRAENCLRDWLERRFAYGRLDEASTILDLVLEAAESAQLIGQSERGRLHDAIGRINDTQMYFEGDEEEECTAAIQEAISCIEHVMVALRHQEKLLQDGGYNGE